MEVPCGRGRCRHPGGHVHARRWRRCATGHRTACAFAIIEEKPPHGIRVFRYSGEAEEIALAKFERAVELWRECQATDIWPNYGDDEVFLDPAFGARDEWGAFTASVKGLESHTQAQRQKDAAVADKIVQQHNWGG